MWEMPASPKGNYKRLSNCSVHFEYNTGRIFGITFQIFTNGIFENAPIL